MCGIAGWFSWSDQRLTRDRIARLWRENEIRGKDAAGVAYLRDRQCMFIKQPGRAMDLALAMNDQQWDTVVRSPLGLLHTRAWTQGRPNVNENNHPVIAYGWVVTHNGGIWNDDYLFEHFAGSDSARPAEVDSVAINLVLSQGQTTEDSLAHACTLRGAASVAALHVERPDEVILFRLGGPPVHLYWLPSMAMLVWSSDQDGIKAVDDVTGGGFAGFSQAFVLPDYTALHLTPSGLSRYALTPRPFGPAYRVYSGRGARSGGGSSSFLPSGQQTSGTTSTGTSQTVVLPPGINSRLVLVDGSKLLELPIFQGSNQEFHYISRYEHKVPAQGALIVHTGYGRWFLTKNENNQIRREFKPHRRIKRMWEQQLGSGVGESYPVSLPASPEQAEDLSDIQHFGQAALHQSDGTEVRVFPALLCPWCGAVRHPAAWKAVEFVCEWCRIRSIPPKEVTQ